MVLTDVTTTEILDSIENSDTNVKGQS